MQWVDPQSYGVIAFVCGKSHYSTNTVVKAFDKTSKLIK
jgi:hypothetical protein